MGKVESMNERAYEKDARFRRYVNKYCEHRWITTAEAPQDWMMYSAMIFRDK